METASAAAHADLDLSPVPARPALPIPETTVSFNLELTATRYPRQTAISYYGGSLDYTRLRDEVEALAGYLQAVCGVGRGDRVLLYMQNSPQFVIAYYAILRADAAVVPINPMNLTEELLHYVEDAGATVAFASAELVDFMRPHLRPGHLERIIVARYADYIDESAGLAVPDLVRARPPVPAQAGVVEWGQALAAGLKPGPAQAAPDDLAVMPYTSGTTGQPKGCMHTHRTLMATIVAAGQMFRQLPGEVMLAVVPFFHVTGMQMVMSSAIYLGAELVIMTRWDRELALDLIRRHGVTSWINIPTMVIDLLASKRADREALATLRVIGGGGAAMPEAIAARLQEVTGLRYIEGYGLTEMAAPSHLNPIDRPRRQCLGTPIFNTEALIVDGDGRRLAVDEIGEIVTRAPQVFKGYWNNPEATAASFIEIDGEPWFRTGDLGRVDAQGYFYMVDRLKRMINAAGFKVWPAEVEALMYKHPDIKEVCVIASLDPRRGETVKAVVVRRDGARVTQEDLLAWAKTQMATYKAPRLVEFVDALPMTSSGKIQWRVLQEAESARSQAT